MKPVLAYHYKYTWSEVGALDIGAMHALMEYLKPPEKENKQEQTYEERLKEKLDLFDKLKKEEAKANAGYLENKKKQEEFRRLKLLSSK